MSSDPRQNSSTAVPSQDIDDSSKDDTTPSETNAHIEGFSYHDNEVRMGFKVDGGYKLLKGVFTITDYCVTDGQDPDHKIQKGQAYTYDGPDGKMSFRVGRKGSKQVSDWWTARIPPSKNTFNHNPNDLNFAFIGKLELTLLGGALGRVVETYTLDDIAIAQGHTDFSNNWWFGGKNAQGTSTVIDANTVRCPGHGPRGTWHFDFSRGFPSSANELIILHDLSTS